MHGRLRMPTEIANVECVNEETHKYCSFAFCCYFCDVSRANLQGDVGSCVTRLKSKQPKSGESESRQRERDVFVCARARRTTNANAEAQTGLDCTNWPTAECAAGERISALISVTCAGDLSSFNWINCFFSINRRLMIGLAGIHKISVAPHPNPMWRMFHTCTDCGWLVEIALQFAHKWDEYSWSG